MSDFIAFFDPACELLSARHCTAAYVTLSQIASTMCLRLGGDVRAGDVRAREWDSLVALLEGAETTVKQRSLEAVEQSLRARGFRGNGAISKALTSK